MPRKADAATRPDVPRRQAELLAHAGEREAHGQQLGRVGGPRDAADQQQPALDAAEADRVDRLLHGHTDVCPGHRSASGPSSLPTGRVRTSLWPTAEI
jgi:hypothetical protein